MNKALQVWMTRSFWERVGKFVLLALVMGGLASCFDNCEPPFPGSSFVDKFRVLAVKAEPPEIAPGEQAVLSFLAVRPDGEIAKDSFPGFPACTSPENLDGGNSAFWIACLPALGPYRESDLFCTGLGGDSGDADAGDGDAGPVDGGNPLASLQPCKPELGSDGKKGQLCLPLPPCGLSIRWTAPKDYLEPLDESRRTIGAEALLILNTRYGKQNQTSLKRLLISEKPKESRNTNPRIKSMKIAGRDIDSCLPTNEEDCETVVIPAGKSFKVEVSIDRDFQDWLPDKPGREKRKEDIILAWYTSAGEFDLQATVFSGQDDNDISPWPRWFPTDYRGKPIGGNKTFRIIVVARDQRGGFDWRIARIRIESP